MTCLQAPSSRTSNRIKLQRHHRRDDYRVFQKEPRSKPSSFEWFEKNKATPLIIIRTEVMDTLERTFRLRVDRWRKETDGLSALEDVITHSDYLKIIGMGPIILPLILRELRDRGGRWHIALESVSECNPVPPEDLGYVKRVKEAWLEWGRKNRYI